MENMKLGRGLPHHIVREILRWVVISNFPNLRVVSKTWNLFILDYAHEFSSTNANAFLLSTCDRTPNNKDLNHKMHCIRFDTTTHLDFDLESEWTTKSPSLSFDGDWPFISLVDNSCNGLVFICKCAFFTRCDGIFNPMTNEFFQIPRGELDGDIYSYELGFSPTTKQYKLFRVTESFFLDGDADNNSSIMDVLTFTRRSETNHNHSQWRRLHSLPLRIHNGAYLNGVIYWIGTKEDKENEYIIYAVNVETELIELSFILDLGPCSTSSHASLKQFNSSVYATFFINPKTYNSSIQVWRMQEKDLWIREFVIVDIPINWSSLTLIKAFEDGEILCMINLDFFCWYNSFTGRKKIVTKNQKKDRRVCQIEYLNFGLLQNILAGEET
ncbi:F-box protein [Cucumis melo var. makuwa]|uniref:F-box protein n=1 Tax=Cucumis melo var. makuwa TaxID=1194695 RepID=A0A5A7TE00_CUCMM|nr:F-box protein [Cucumis melo var. makuwa]TYK24750.1 F-box protein [Cucumis melo var. makuwa]